MNNIYFQDDFTPEEYSKDFSAGFQRVPFICSVSSEVENVVAQLHHGPDEQSPQRDANQAHQDVH